MLYIFDYFGFFFIFIKVSIHVRIAEILNTYLVDTADTPPRVGEELDK